MSMGELREHSCVAALHRGYAHRGRWSASQQGPAYFRLNCWDGSKADA